MVRLAGALEILGAPSPNPDGSDECNREHYVENQEVADLGYTRDPPSIVIDNQETVGGAGNLQLPTLRENGEGPKREHRKPEEDDDDQWRYVSKKLHVESSQPGDNPILR